jgi:hypothetical protein
MRVREFLSLSGSFSRTEFAIALGVIFSMAVVFAALKDIFPETISYGTYEIMVWSLYPVWGMATGKRSRDLGTTFTYGMLVGMFFPVIAIVFLFQAGEKYKRAQTPRNARSAPPNTVGG